MAPSSAGIVLWRRRAASDDERGPGGGAGPAEPAPAEPAAAEPAPAEPAAAEPAPAEPAAAEPAPAEPAAAEPAPFDVLLVHPGGPFWRRRDDGWWSIPKGEVLPEEDGLHAAEREFAEELGVALPPGPRQPLGMVVQRGGKRVEAWAVEGDFDPDHLSSGMFTIEWPPRSGVLAEFPEVDRAVWFGLEAARRKLLGAQVPFLDRLALLLGSGAAGA